MVYPITAAEWLRLALDDKLEADESSPFEVDRGVVVRNFNVRMAQLGMTRLEAAKIAGYDDHRGLVNLLKRDILTASNVYKLAMIACVPAESLLNPDPSVVGAVAIPPPGSLDLVKAHIDTGQWFVIDFGEWFRYLNTYEIKK